MAKTVKHMRWWPRPWEYRQAEAWLEDMALKGWMLTFIGFVFARFEKREPSSCRFRCVLQGNSMRLSEEEALKKSYLDAGWKYIGEKNNRKIYAIQDNGEPIVDPTDPERQEKQARKRICEKIIWVVVSVLIYVAGFCYLNWDTHNYLNFVVEQELRYTLFTIWFLNYWMSSAREIVSFIKSRKTKIGPPVNYPSRVATVSWMIHFVLLMIFFAPGPGYLLHTFVDERLVEHRYSIMDIAAPAGLELVDPEQAGLNLGIERYGVMYPYYRLDNLSADLIPTGVDRETYNSDFMILAIEEYRALFPVIARNLADMRSEYDWWFDYYAESKPKILYENVSGFDRLWRYDDEDDHRVVALRGNTVYCVWFSGPVSSEQLIAFLNDKVIDPKDTKKQ